MLITAYQVERDAPEIVPGRPDREWMNETAQRFAYRCLPLSMANSTGWNIILPFDVNIEWDGTPDQRGLKIRSPNRLVKTRMTSHFGHGVVTFHTGYLFRTPPGWALWVRGAPNTAKDGIVPLDGIVETDWSVPQFTMNWMMTRPGTVSFKKGESFCFVTPFPHAEIDSFQMKKTPLFGDKALAEEHLKWTNSRAEFNKKLQEQDPETLAHGWQKNYMRGEYTSGEKTCSFHTTNRKMTGP